MGDLDNALVHAELSERYGSPDTEYLSSLKEFIRQRLHAQQSKQYQQHQATETQLESIVDWFYRVIMVVSEQILIELFS